MLSSAFLDAKRLQISEELRQGAIRVLHKMEAGHYTHVRVKGFIGLLHEIKFPKRGFNMCYYSKDGRMGGVVHCIGGWIYCETYGIEIWHGPFHVAHPLGSSFNALCHGYVSDDVTCEAGAAALRNFLTMNNPMWPQVKEEFGV